MKKKIEKPGKDWFMVCCDHQRRTCIQVDRKDGRVAFIPLSVEDGLQVNETSEQDFDQRFKPMVDYPIDKACRLYAGYAKDIGATKQALDFLGQIINITPQEYDMATKKKATNEAAVKDAKAKALAKTPAKKTVTAKTKAAPIKKVSDVKKPGIGKKAPQPNTTKKHSASQMFKDLIMEGELTDDQIFAKVQAEFGLDEKKRGYVKWYRNDLKKSGANPPEPKV